MTNSKQYAGSTGVRSFLEQHPVDLCICGHIHEAAGISNIGECKILNPGSFSSGNYAEIYIDKDIRISLQQLRR